MGEKRNGHKAAAKPTITQQAQHAAKKLGLRVVIGNADAGGKVHLRISENGNPLSLVDRKCLVTDCLQIVTSVGQRQQGSHNAAGGRPADPRRHAKRVLNNG